MYVKTTNGEIDQYPYTVANLRRDNPNVSFPKYIPSDRLAEWGVYKVTTLAQPSFNSNTQVCTRDALPSLQSNAWVLGWTVSNRTAEEQVKYDNSQAEINRTKRDNIIASTDWWASSDLTMTAEQTAYRQALRDITTHANWPHLEESDWPTKP